MTRTCIENTILVIEWSLFRCFTWFHFFLFFILLFCFVLIVVIIINFHSNGFLFALVDDGLCFVFYFSTIFFAFFIIIILIIIVIVIIDNIVIRNTSIDSIQTIKNDLLF